MTGKERIKRANRLRRLRDIIGCVLLVMAFLTLFFSVIALESGRFSLTDSGVSMMIALVMCAASVPVFGW